MSDNLAELEARSIYIIREAYARVNPMAMLWSIGKDSTAMLWLVRKAFFGRVPFPLVLLDTGMEMDEVYAFRDMLTQEWDLPVVTHMCPPEEEMDQTLPPATRAAMRKTEGLKSLLEKEKYKGVICGIRRDEQGMSKVYAPKNVCLVRVRWMGHGILKINPQNFGINIKPKCLMIAMCVFILYFIGRSWIFGVI